MNVCLYSPYIPKHTGGGEKYLFDVALELAKKHQVKIAVPQLSLENERQFRQKYELFLNRSLAAIEFIPTPLNANHSFWKKILWTKQFDVLYYLTDGSLFFSLAKRNILHIQFPLDLDKSGFIDQAKLRNWQVKNTNSLFTKQVVEKSWPVHIDVVHNPQVDTIELAKCVKPKEKIILSVGRFFKQLHSKRQDVLVKIFKKMLTEHVKEMSGWKLLLVGGVEDTSYLSEVQSLASGLPVEIHTTLNRQELLDCYGKASIYWHATGFEVDEQQYPEKVEHFGISTVEAMAAKCVPIVVGKGGQLEVIGDELRELLWTTEDECIAKTLTVITNNTKQAEFATQAQQRAQTFGAEVFAQKLLQMVEGKTNA